MKLITVLVLFVSTLLFSMSTFSAPSDRQERRQERGRADERQERRDCRREEGVVGEDKRECKQEEVRDGVGGDKEPDAEEATTQ